MPVQTGYEKPSEINSNPLIKKMESSNRKSW